MLSNRTLPNLRGSAVAKKSTYRSSKRFKVFRANDGTYNLRILNQFGFEMSSYDLSGRTTSAGILDLILQLNKKRYCTPEFLKTVVNQLEAASREIFPVICMQGAFCPCGQDRIVDWSKGTTRPMFNQSGGAL